MTGDPARPLAGHPLLVTADIQRLFAVLGAGGTPVRVVGGAVRDALLGARSDRDDIDLATPLVPEAVLARLRDAGIKAVPTGIAHGTVTAVLGGRPFEITTLRRDVATDGRHAVVAYTRDFDTDAARRDFTINAMSADPDGYVHDPFGGRADLAAGTLRFVGDPARRIAEDHLRILRFFRFHARFNTGPTDALALAACADAAGCLDRLSGERVRQETLKLLATRDPTPTLRLMVETGVAAALFRTELAVERLARLVAQESEDDAGAEAEPLVRLAALLRPPPAATDAQREVAARFRFSVRESEALAALCTLPLPALDGDARAWRLAIYDHGTALFAGLGRLAAAEPGRHEPARRAALALARDWTPPRPPIQGRDLLELGMTPGPELGRALERAVEWWRSEDFRPDRAACLAWIEREAAGPGEG